MTKYTLHINCEQKEIIVKALAAYGHMMLGQTGNEQLVAKKLAPHLRKANHHAPINLCDLDVQTS